MIITYTRDLGLPCRSQGWTGFDDLLRYQGDAFVAFRPKPTDEEWERSGLCVGWTNEDVLAHLSLGLRLPLLGSC
ncbi:maleylpyruvate isomerase N-terminal domain-containing protein [Micromonospora pisi]|uniref:maleylpyruvate isomerase N-terminal domain-containing protein n=1 Tax=Micromonospora pisi TaxID=589240 RepID=UPI0014776F04|nr:maleylpyruvate isomerase N-terminal domain-containing protein [Micromonospora pisi]